jgi:hypothetical protein
VRGGEVSFVVPAARGRGGDERATFAVLVTGFDRSREGAAAILGERIEGEVRARVGALLLVYGEDRSWDGCHLLHCIDLYRVDRGAQLVRLDQGTLSDPWIPAVLVSIERAQAGAYDH